ncbi:hypothetical protein OROGR_008419 [Orobanche gracilis]
MSHVATREIIGRIVGRFGSRRGVMTRVGCSANCAMPRCTGCSSFLFNGDSKKIKIAAYLPQFVLDMINSRSLSFGRHHSKSVYDALIPTDAANMYEQ